MIIKDAERISKKRMYSLYIPKYQRDLASALRLPEELGRFMEATDYAYNLLVSPGFLSRTDKTINGFLDRLEQGLSDPKNREKKVGLGLFHGMNGYNSVSKGSSLTVLAAHDAALLGRSGLEKIAVDPQKRDDHRKIIFFFKFLKEAVWDITKSLNQGNMKDFLKQITVEAVLIGSSNFSWSTYYNAGRTLPEKGEADLLMFVDESYEATVAEGIMDTDMALFEMIACREEPMEFLKNILRDFLAHSLN